MNPYAYAMWLWFTLFQPTPQHYAPPPTRPAVYWQTTMPIQTPTIVSNNGFNPSQWPPGYVPNPTQMGLTNSGCRVLQPGLTVCN